MEYKVVSECNKLEVWARGFYGDAGKERAQKKIAEGYWHRYMYNATNTKS